MGSQIRSFRLPEETIAVIRKVKNVYGIQSDTQALIQLVADYDHKLDRNISDADADAICSRIMDQIRREFRSLLSRVAHSAAETERQTYLTLDAVNTMLYDSSATFLMDAKGQLRHEVIRQSEENYFKMLERSKQIRDNRRWKEEVMNHGRDPDPGP